MIWRNVEHAQRTAVIEAEDRAKELTEALLAVESGGKLWAKLCPQRVKVGRVQWLACAGRGRAAYGGSGQHGACNKHREARRTGTKVQPRRGTPSTESSSN